MPLSVLPRRASPNRSLSFMASRLSNLSRSLRLSRR